MIGKHWRTHQKRMRRAGLRSGYTLLELIVSTSAGAVLVAGLSGSLYIASHGFDRTTRAMDLSVSQEILGEMVRNLNQAIRFTERTATAVTFTVPDRTGDNLPETIRYAWTGAAGDPLIYEYNNSSVELATGVQNFSLSYLTRMVTGENVSGTVPVAGVVFEEFTSKKDGTGNPSTTIDTPPGASAGDLLVAVVVVDGSDLIAPPAGWNEVSLGVSTNQVAVGVWWKLAGSTEPLSHTFTWTNFEQSYGWMMRFTGHDAANPINVSAAANGTSSTPVSPAVTTSVDNATILRLGGFDDDDITIGSTGLTGQQTILMEENKNGNGTVSGGAGYASQATAGDSGALNFSLTNTEEWWTVTLGIAPAP